MIPQRLKLPLLAVLAGGFLTMPLAAQRRRVFTNDDFPAAPAPAAPVASTPDASSKASPSTEAAPAPSEPAEPAGALPAANIAEGLPLAQHLQEVLQRYRMDISIKLEQDFNSARQDRWKNIVNIVTQLIVHNQMHIADLQAQQEAEAAAQAGAQPAP